MVMVVAVVEEEEEEEEALLLLLTVLVVVEAIAHLHPIIMQRAHRLHLLPFEPQRHVLVQQPASTVTRQPRIHHLQTTIHATGIRY